MENGVRVDVPDVAILVRASRRDCAVSEWSAWSSCSDVCRAGTQTRSRRVVTSPTSDGARCPATTESRSCNTCDVCATVTCANGGQCVDGVCVRADCMVLVIICCNCVTDIVAV
jgi:hypothetical protein